jgi:hypothetical protein
MGFVKVYDMPTPASNSIWRGLRPNPFGRRFEFAKGCTRESVRDQVVNWIALPGRGREVTGQTGVETASGSRHGALRGPLSPQTRSAPAPNSLATFAKKRRFRRGRLSASAVNWIVGQVHWERVISARVTLLIKSLCLELEARNLAFTVSFSAACG